MTAAATLSERTGDSTRHLVGRLWREHIRGYRAWLGFAVVMMAMTAAATAFSAYLMKPIVNEVFIARDEATLWLVAAAILVTFLVKGIANYGQATLMAHVGLRVIADCQNRLYAHLSRMNVGYFHDNPSGSLISRFTIDINQMRAAVSNAIVGFGKDLLTLVALTINMVVMDWQLSIIALIVFPIAVMPVVRLGRRMRKVTANTQHEMGLLNALLNQTFQGIRVVKAYVMEEYEKGRVADIVDRIRLLNLKAARTRAMAAPVMELLAGLAIGVVIVYGGFQVIEDQSRAGEIFSFITALLLAYEPMKRLANLNASLQEGLAGAQRMYEVLDTLPLIVERPGARDLTVTSGHVRLEDVAFSYSGDKKALRNVTIDVPPGRTVALVGPSGAGKSTILNLIPRFYDVDSGRIVIDGVDTATVTFDSLRRSLALVSQEVMLFDDTVRANIAYGRAGATDEEIVAAARDAAALDFIRELPGGFDTMVGELGVKLSGGQRQRIAIARAILKDAPILLLDEATSALDTESERQVQDALDHLRKGRTTIVIAHRLSTVMSADLIYVLDDGRIVEQGAHHELVSRGGHYARLHALQFAGQPEAEGPARIRA